MEGQPFTRQRRAESPLRIAQRERALPHRRARERRRDQAHARGTLLDPLRLRDFDLQLALSGQDMADLYPLIGIVTPADAALPARWTADPRDHRTDGRIWRYDDFNGVVGDSDLAGDASVETGARTAIPARGRGLETARLR